MLGIGPASVEQILAAYVLVLAAIALAALTRGSRATRPSSRRSRRSTRRSGRGAAHRCARPSSCAPSGRSRSAPRAPAISTGACCRSSARPPSARLSAGHNVDLARRPDAARALLGEDAWELLRPDRPEPHDRNAPGIPMARLSQCRRHAGEAVMELPALREHASRVLDEVERAIVGKRDALELILLALLSDGHVLLEDYPGLAKTLIARSFAQATSLEFSPHPVHAGPDALRRDRLVDLRPARRASSRSCPARSSPTSCSPTRSTAPHRRRRLRCSRRCRSAR